MAAAPECSRQNNVRVDRVPRGFLGQVGNGNDPLPLVLGGLVPGEEETQVIAFHQFRLAVGPESAGATFFHPVCVGGNGLFQGQLQALFQQFRVENDRDFGVLADEDAALGGMPNIGQGMVRERQGKRVGRVVFQPVVPNVWGSQAQPAGANDLDGAVGVGADDPVVGDEHRHIVAIGPADQGVDRHGKGMPAAGGVQHGVGNDGCLGRQGFERGKPAVFGVVKHAQVDAMEEFFITPLRVGGQ